MEKSIKYNSFLPFLYTHFFFFFFFNWTKNFSCNFAVLSQHRALTCSWYICIYHRGIGLSSRIRSELEYELFFFSSVNMYCIYSRLYMDGCIIKKSTFFSFLLSKKRKGLWFESKTWAVGQENENGVWFWIRSVKTVVVRLFYDDGRDEIG